MSKKILSNEVSNGDAFTDLLFNALLGFAFMFFISFALIQKPQDGGKIDSKAEFIISAEWEEYHPDDIDLIVEDPQGNIVYFQRQQAGLMHLDRDDRGTLADRIMIDGVEVENPANQEVVTIRGYMEGEYVVNLLYYKSNFIAPLKVKVKVEKINPRLEVVYFNDFFLKKIGDEITAVRFILDDKGNVLDLNQLQKPIISGKVK
ncbi:hypothetical protein OAN34_00385 [Hyphomicrobiales bacterium]|nr:hypothetical protein [Hyphomicrobiales bacterium]MDG1153128.1 hypothetical protein [Hyphomicrobiales bacterium]MDG1524402.1 hypothetical protein [Hyphomicrobiales bacterium]MDG1664767.1 hypothetical protein [Hyphomicrobiales bacterium]MDG2413556.1 hypothetical protein [Hyphomicrobiales bacterium]